MINHNPQFMLSSNANVFKEAYDTFWKDLWQSKIFKNNLSCILELSVIILNINYINMSSTDASILSQNHFK